MGKEAFTFHGSCQVDGTSGDHSCSPLEDEANKEVEKVCCPDISKPLDPAMPETDHISGLI